MNWLAGITKEDLPQNYLEMVTVIEEITGPKTAMQIVLKLAEHFNKQSIYFRSFKPIVTEKKKRFVIERFRGSNHVELARMTDFSVQYVYEMIADQRKLNLERRKEA